MPREKLREWAGEDEPIILSRNFLTTKYVLLTLLGVAVSLATAPSLDEVMSSESYSSAWGVLLAIAGIVAAIGSRCKTFEAAEKIGATGLFALLTVYALSPILLVLQGDMDRLAYSVVAVTISLAPGARLIQLIRGSANG